MAPTAMQQPPSLPVCVPAEIVSDLRTELDVDSLFPKDAVLSLPTNFHEVLP